MKIKTLFFRTTEKKFLRMAKLRAREHREHTTAPPVSSQIERDSKSHPDVMTTDIDHTQHRRHPKGLTHYKRRLYRFCRV
jgi:hypothetical protein